MSCSSQFTGGGDILIFRKKDVALIKVALTITKKY